MKRCVLKTKIFIFALALVLSLLVAGAALAEGGLELPRWVLSGGATNSAAGEVSIQATLGQPFVGVVSNGQAFLSQGFWHGGREAIPDSGHDIYLPLILR